MKIKAAVMEKSDGVLTRRSIKLEDVELEEPRADEVLLKITSCGVCGTDRGCLHGQEPYPSPGVLGHEGAGTVEAVGAEVDNVRVGDRVMAGFPFCGKCRSCRRGQPRYCLHGADLMFSGWRLDGSSPMQRSGGEKLAARFFQQSSWATHAVALGLQVVKVPDGVDADLMGPLGCSITTGAGSVLNELRPVPNSSLAIFGAGNVGLAAVMAARLSGTTTIIVIDKVPARLALARELGATHTIEGGSDAVREVKDITSGELDYAIEATNGSNLVAEAVEALGTLGVCAMVGGAKATVLVKLAHGDMLHDGKTLTGVMGGGGHRDQAYPDDGLIAGDGDEPHRLPARGSPSRAPAAPFASRSAPILCENVRTPTIDVNQWCNLQALLLQSASARPRIVVIHDGGRLLKLAHSQHLDIARPIERVDRPREAAEAVFRANEDCADFVAVFERRAVERYFAQLQDGWRADELVDEYERRAFKLLGEAGHGIVTYPTPATEMMGLQWRVGAGFAAVEAAMCRTRSSFPKPC